MRVMRPTGLDAPAAARRGVWHGLLPVWLAVLGALASPAARALDRELALSQFYHASWTAKDGAPQSVWEIEETADGWIWLGGRRGLYRFDGLQFERFEAPPDRPFPSANVARLRAAPNGDLWVGFLGGGLSRVRGGEVTHFGSAEGVPAREVRAIVVEPDGTVWAATPSDLLRFDGTRWVRIGQGWGLEPGDSQISGLLVDHKGTVWFTESRGAWALRRGARRFERVPVDLAGSSDQTIDGRGWVIDGRRMFPMPDVDPTAAVSDSPWLGRRHGPILVDRQHNLWSAFCEAGLCRSRLPRPLGAAAIELPAPEERYDRRDGLSGDIVSNVIEDRSGSLWVSTQTGLDRFRRSHLVPVATPGGFARHLLPEADGSVTVLGAGSSTYTAPRRWRVGRQAEALPENTLAAGVHRDAQGRVWLAGPGGLSLAGKPQSLVPWPDTAVRDRSVSIASDAGGLWVTAPGAPLLRYAPEPGRFVPPAEPDLQQARPRSVAVGSDGRTWFCLDDNRVLSLRAGQVRTYSAADGLDIGPAACLHAGGRVLAAGGRGVAVLHGERFHRIVAEDPEAFAAVSGIVETPDGHFWFNGLKGVVRVAASELEAQARDPGHRLRYRLFDEFDGHSGSARHGNASAAVGADGRLWFISAPGNVVWLDPRRVDERLPAPMPAVRSVEAAGMLYRPAQAIELPALTQGVNLRYTALGAAIPERVRFRYRLEGLETGWTDAGRRREVSYANLGPGSYVFQVQASPGDGSWTESPATLAFSIRPAFFQTTPFKLLCAALSAGLLWLLVRLRTRQVERRARQQMQVRIDERESIARDLHDTLLQGVTGLTLHVRAAVNQAPPESPLRARLEHALTRANEVMVEGRERVGALRRVHLDGDELAGRLRCAAADLAQDWSGPAHTLEIEGAPRPLHAAAADEVYWIAREALANAFRHAHATRIVLRLRYGLRSLELEVHDDGSGFDTTAPRPGGHFGLAGLKERADRIEARLELRSGPGGTVLTLKVPGRLIYTGPPLADPA